MFDNLSDDQLRQVRLALLDRQAILQGLVGDDGYGRPTSFQLDYELTVTQDLVDAAYNASKVRA